MLKSSIELDEGRERLFPKSFKFTSKQGDFVLLSSTNFDEFSAARNVAHDFARIGLNPGFGWSLDFRRSRSDNDHSKVYELRVIRDQIDRGSESDHRSLSDHRSRSI